VTNTQLEVKELCVGFYNRKGSVQILDNVSFTVNKGETLGIVGESGCGKSLTSLSVMGLLPEKGKISNGEVNFENDNLVNKNMKQMSKIRGNDISMIFQEPMTSLNPVHTIGKQISEVVQVHMKAGAKRTKERTLEMLRLVGIPSPEKRMNDYPHQMSGGMRQRVMIAMALACNPKLLIADEPTTALDVTIQAQILELMNGLKDKMNMSIMLITHDLGVVSEMADNVLVMYAGQVVEYSPVEELFKNPKHPYTQGLIASIPNMEEEQKELPIIKGSVPTPEDMPAGCRFSTRCPFAQEICRQESPQLSGESWHKVSCWMYTDKWNPEEANEHVDDRETPTAQQAARG
jgi:oligopeptide/dipeptide ABC transporter ATP-binding protein